MANAAEQAKAKEDAKAKDATPKPHDETEPGGRYVVNGRLVNAHGESLEQAPAPTKA